MTSSTGGILAGYESLRAGQEALYKDLRQHPELSRSEHRAARPVAGQRQDAGFMIASGIDGTGVAGVLATGSGPTVLLRCELGALPPREATGVPYAATASDASGREVPVGHACEGGLRARRRTRAPWLRPETQPFPARVLRRLGRRRIRGYQIRARVGDTRITSG